MNRPRAKSVGAVLAGLVAVVVLSTAADQGLRSVGIYPPASQRMSDPLFLLATLYRVAFGVVGGYLTARLAPNSPARHASVLGIFGVVLSAGGVVAGILQPNLGPLWYPIVLLLAAWPSAWLGGMLGQGRNSH